MTDINFTQIAPNGLNHEEIWSPFDGEDDIAKTIQAILKRETQLEKK